MAAVDSVITIEDQPALWSLLSELAEDQRQSREYLGRLVEIEEERRNAERQMEASLWPDASDDTSPPIDWYRDSQLTYRERGTDRALAQSEVEAIGQTPKARR